MWPCQPAPPDGSPIVFICEATYERLDDATVEGNPLTATWSLGTGAATEQNGTIAVTGIKFLPPGSGYLKVWAKTVTDTDSAPVALEDARYHNHTETPLTPVVWTGTGSLCLPDPTRPCNDPANAITVPLEVSLTPEHHTFLYSDDPGAFASTVSIAVVKYSCLPGYEPPDDGSANGYPVPGR